MFVVNFMEKYYTDAGFAYRHFKQRIKGLKEEKKIKSVFYIALKF